MRSLTTRLREQAQDIRDSWCDCNPIGSGSEWYERDMALAHLLDDAATRIETVEGDAIRLARRNTMLIAELEDRRGVFTPEQLKRAIVKAMYEGQG